MRQSHRGTAWSGPLVLALVLVTAGCGSSTIPSPSLTASAPASAPVTDTPGLPTSSPVSPESSAPPSGSDPPSISPVPTGSAASGAAASCSGTAENRDFFATVAGLVTWDVYCAVVPDGWFVESGKWRLRDGGRLDVAYKGPNGAHLVLAEGVFCTEGVSVCTPHDQIIGTTAFGDRQGQLATLGGGYVIYVNPGQRPAWQVTGTGLDQQTFVALAGALFKVGQ